ncbi:MAG: hypothetical protein KGM96_12140 [Acidobacteriota bacterium]|nr:hypothetical protein [Acidobacteriota bacterium]
MIRFRRYGLAPGVVFASLLACLGTCALPAQQLDPSSVIERIDAAVKARLDNIAGYTDIERYAVYRNNDETHPVAAMRVKTDYEKATGKNYTILSQSGSAIIRNLVLGTILDNEKRLNLPGNREGAWITSSNYEMKLEGNGIQHVDGKDCLALALIPKRKTPYLIEGTLWVDAKDYSIVQIRGTSSRSASIFSGRTQMMRQYALISGFAQATHASAVSNTSLFGKTIVTIDYDDYQIKLAPGH